MWMLREHFNQSEQTILETESHAKKWLTCLYIMFIFSWLTSLVLCSPSKSLQSKTFKLPGCFLFLSFEKTFYTLIAAAAPMWCNVEKLPSTKNLNLTVVRKWYLKRGNDTSVPSILTRCVKSKSRNRKAFGFW